MSNLSIEDIQKLKENLKQRGYKLTPQRRAILNGFLQNEGRHLTVEEIYDDVKEQCPEIGLATVYRTVLLLEEMGIIYRLDLEDGCARYELVHENENHRHHHLVCSNCGDVIEVEEDLLENIENIIETQYNFKIMDHSVKFFGMCSKCKSEN